MPWAEDALVEAAVKWEEEPVQLFDGHGLPPHKQEGLEIEALELKLRIAEFEVSITSMRLFLWLLYTGCVDPKDWQEYLCWGSSLRSRWIE